MKPAVQKYQRELARKKIVAKRADGHLTDRAIAEIVGREVNATPEQVLKWMREDRT
jgi:hypothetical protein